MNDNSSFDQTIYKSDTPGKYLGITLACIFVYQAAGAILTLALDGILSEIWSISFAQILFLLVPLIILSKKQFGSIKEPLKLKGRPTALSVFIVLIGSMAGILITEGWMTIQPMLVPDALNSLELELERLLRSGYDSLMTGNSPTDFAAALLGTALLPAVGEELLFRGFLLGGLRKHFSPQKAILISSALFAAVHLNPIVFVPIFVLGLYFALLTEITGSIFPAVIAHFLNNAASVTAVFMSRNGFSDNFGLSDFSESLSGVLVITGAFIMAGAVWSIKADQKRLRQRENLFRV